MTAKPETIEDALMRSGFPLQTTIRHVIQNHPGGYKIHRSEYAWSNRINEQGFLDIVALNRDLVLTVECKKTEEKKYIFLLPEGQDGYDNVAKFTCLWISRYDSPGRQPAIHWTEREIQPMCPSSEFCIVNTTNNNERMLERDAGLLINASDALTWDLQEVLKMNLSPPYSVIPVLVTNAELYLVRYHPKEVSLTSGQFNQTPKDVKKESWVRFHKTLISGRGHDTNLQTRTIFIVNALSLSDFLIDLKEITSGQTGPCVHLRREDWA